MLWNLEEGKKNLIWDYKERFRDSNWSGWENELGLGRTF